MLHSGLFYNQKVQKSATPSNFKALEKYWKEDFSKWECEIFETYHPNWSKMFVTLVFSKLVYVWWFLLIEEPEKKKIGQKSHRKITTNILAPYL